MATTPDTEPAEMLTYTTATPEQVADRRAEARQKLAELKQEWTAERWEQAREQLRQRLNAA